MSDTINISDETLHVQGDSNALLPDTSTEETPAEAAYSISDYLLGCVNIDIPSEVLVRICLDRDISYNAEATEVEKSVRDLCKADLLVWMVMGVSKRGTVSDTDNGWTHSDGGFTLTDADKVLFLKMANEIYEENGEDTIGKTKATFRSQGIRPADYTLQGEPVPHILK